jgi:hypothetical protein
MLKLEDYLQQCSHAILMHDGRPWKKCFRAHADHDESGEQRDRRDGQEPESGVAHETIGTHSGLALASDARCRLELRVAASGKDDVSTR